MDYRIGNKKMNKDLVADKKSKIIKNFLRKEIDPAFKRRAEIILTKSLFLKAGMRALDLGCGRGFYTKALAILHPDVQITALDLNEKYLKQARKLITENNVNLVKADARNLPFTESSFDFVVCSEVLEHIQEDEKVISEIKRVLTKNGTALITVPHKNYPFLWDPINWILQRLFNKHIPSDIWWLAGIWADHIRLYSEEDLVAKVKKAGFGVEKIWRSTYYCLPFAHFLLYGIGKNLVELGIAGGSFNRFKIDNSLSFANKFVNSPFRIIDKLNYRNFNKNSSFVNLIIKVAK